MTSNNTVFMLIKIANHLVWLYFIAWKSKFTRSWFKIQYKLRIPVLKNCIIKLQSMIRMA